MIKKTSGQTTLEVVFAIGVMAVFLSSIAVGSVFFLRSTRTARNYSLASTLAQEKIEEYRAMAVTNKAGFWQLVQGDDPEDEIIASTDTYTRQTEFDYTDDRVKITVRVGWWQGEEYKESVVSSYVTNY